MREVKWYTQETYYRLMAADLLPGGGQDLYLDCDIVVLEDVAHLYAVDMGDALLGMVPDPPHCGPGMSSKLGVDVDLTFNAGVLLCNLAEWRKIGLYEKSMAALERFQGRLLYQDQDALAIVCSRRTMALDRRWNGMTCQPNRRGVLQGGIVHMFSVTSRGTLPATPTTPSIMTWPRARGVLPPPSRSHASARRVGRGGALAACAPPGCARSSAAPWARATPSPRPMCPACGAAAAACAWR